MTETKREETADSGAQLDRKDRQHREQVQAPASDDQESPAGRDVPPSDAGRDPKSPWLGGG